MSQKKGNIGAGQAGVLDLKAEVFRNRQLVSAQRTASINADNGSVSTKLASRFIEANSQHKKRAKERQAKELERSKPVRDDAPTWDVMRAALERKEKMYNKLKRKAAGIEDNENEDKTPGSLIDFVKKRYDELQQEPAMHVDSNSDYSDSDSNRNDDERKGEEREQDEIIEIMDEFGRMRHVKRSEAYRHLPPSEKEEQAEMAFFEQEGTYLNDRNDEPLPSIEQHFDTGQEVRTMGTGFYRFSQNDGERSQQLADLRKLREQTMEMRRRAGQTKDRRRQALERRVRMIMKRRISKLGELGKKARWTIDVSGILSVEERKTLDPTQVPALPTTLPTQPSDAPNTINKASHSIAAAVDDFLNSLNKRA